MKIVLLSVALCALSLASTAQSRFYNGQYVFVCLPSAGSCKARIVREGRDSALVRYMEDCKVERGIGSVSFGLFGLFDKEVGMEEWISKEEVQTNARDCP